MDALIPLFKVRMAGSEGLAESTLVAYESDLRRFAKWCKEEKVTLPSQDVVDRFLVADKQRKVGPEGRVAAKTTGSRAKATLKRFFRWAYEDGHLASDLGRNIKCRRRDRETSRPRHGFDDKGADLLRQQLARTRDPERNLLLLEFALESGLRPASFLPARLEQVDFRTRTFAVWVVKSHEYQAMPVSDRLLRAVSKYVDATGAGPGSLLFPSSRKGEKPLSRQGALSVLREAATGAHVTGSMTFQRLRRAFSQGLEAKGAPLRVIQSALGHKDPSTTQIYLGQPNSVDIHEWLNRESA